MFCSGHAPSCAAIVNGTESLLLACSRFRAKQLVQYLQYSTKHPRASQAHWQPTALKESSDLLGTAL
eukprot:scaffold252670_cov21-Tisochrysis_lutea.AAC.1